MNVFEPKSSVIQERNAVQALGITQILYTLGFCMHEDYVLLLQRKYPPNENLWNGLGGKIESIETPYENIQREIFEESGITIHATDDNYKGIVTWTIQDEQKIGGTHLFIFTLPHRERTDIFNNPREGQIEWKKLSWVIDPKNTRVVENIPLFLPPAMKSTQPRVFDFQYAKRNTLVSFSIPD